MQKPTSISILAGLLLLPAAAFAVDGVVLISQAGALAGNITPGDTPGFPITISQPGSYRLSGDLIAPDVNTTVIEITSNNVTIDLNGFSILGSNVCTPRTTFGVKAMSCTAGSSATGNGIHAAGTLDNPTLNIAVRNGSILGMGSNGIDLRTSAGVLIETVTVAHSGQFGMQVQDAVVRQSTVRSNGQGGVAAGFSVVDRVVAAQHFGNNTPGISGGFSRVINCLMHDNTVGLSAFGGSFTGNVMLNNDSDLDPFAPGINFGQNQCGSTTNRVCPGATN